MEIFPEFLPQKADPCQEHSIATYQYGSWDFTAALRDLDTLKLEPCLLEYRQRADTTDWADHRYQDYLTLKAAALLLKKKIGRAEQILETAHQIDTTQKSQYLLAYIYLLSDQYEEAMRILNRLGDNFPYDWSGGVLSHLKMLARLNMLHPNLAKAYRQLKGQELDDYEKALFQLD